MRSLSVISADIRKDWKNPNYALPYLEAMETLHSIHDKYYLDDAYSIVAYFLSNATSWRGEKARAIKAELKQIMKEA